MPISEKTRSVLCFCAVLSISLNSARAADTASTGPYLILLQQPHSPVAYPQYVKDHLATIEKTPFDGIAVMSNTAWTLMRPTEMTYASIDAEFSPLTSTTFSKLKHNFAIVESGQSPDFFDDWTVVIKNFTNLARVLKERGFDGVFFDNEEYTNVNIFNYPDDCKYAGTKTLEQYQAQALLRGRQVMEAMQAVFPAITVMHLHGPYGSFDRTPSLLLRTEVDTRRFELGGPFFAGFVEGTTTGRSVDGGENYSWRTPAEFDAAYNFRKFDFASSATNVPFLSSSLRSVWSQKTDIAFGVFNWTNQGYTMDPGILKTTLVNALTRSDHYVWFYVEPFDSTVWDFNFYVPGSVGQTWIDSIAAARAAVPYRSTTPVTTPPPTTPPPTTPPPTTNASFVVGDRVIVSGSPSLAVRINVNDAVAGQQAQGQYGAILAGPYNDVSTGYRRWNVNFDSGIDGWVNELGISFVSHAIIADTLAPTSPSNLVATVTSSSQVNLTWTLSTDNVAVKGYKIFRDGIEIATSASNSYSNVSLPADTSYYYYVKAFDAAGNISLKSSNAFARTFLPATFSAGQRVKVVGSSSLAVRPSPETAVSGSQPLGQGGTVISGPVVSFGYPRWNVNFDSGVDGWVNELSLSAWK